MGSRIIESATYYNQILLAQLRAQSISVNWIIRFLLSLICLPKVILLSGGHCIRDSNHTHLNPWLPYENCSVELLIIKIMTPSSGHSFSNIKFWLKDCYGTVIKEILCIFNKKLLCWVGKAFIKSAWLEISFHIVGLCAVIFF